MVASSQIFAYGLTRRKKRRNPSVGYRMGKLTVERTHQPPRQRAQGRARPPKSQIGSAVAIYPPMRPKGSEPVRQAWRSDGEMRDLRLAAPAGFDWDRTRARCNLVGLNVLSVSQTEKSADSPLIHFPFFDDHNGSSWFCRRDRRLDAGFALSGEGRRFAYVGDRLFLVAVFLYAMNRLVWKPEHPGHGFFHDHFNDVLLIPAALPLVLWVHRKFGWRTHDGPPRAGEVVLHLVVWTLVCEVIGPKMLGMGVGDPLDAASYGIGAVIAWWWWHRWAEGTERERVPGPGSSRLTEDNPW